MNKQQIRNGSVFPIEKEKNLERLSPTTQKETLIPADNGLVLEELFIAVSLHALIMTGEFLDAGHRAVKLANLTIDAMHEDRYGGK
jgi:hypothetical protein